MMNCRSQGSWQTLFQREEAESIRCLVSEIAEALLKPDPGWELRRPQRDMPEDLRQFRKANLADGAAGIALLHGYQFQSTARPQDRDNSRALLEQAIDAIAEAPTPPSLFSGFLGVAWAVQHLLPILGLEDQDPLTAIDDALELLLADQDSVAEFDLISGVAGWGVYALSRWPRRPARRLVDRIVERLFATAERDNGLMTWKTPAHELSPAQRDAYPDGFYNLGMAHGVAGVVALLGAAHVVGVADNRIPDGIVSATRWILQQDCEPASTSRFAKWVAPGRMPRGSRFAWCYGDPGVLIALFHAAQAIEHKELLGEVLAIARIASDIESPHPDIVDHGLCHGTAGVGHIFNRFYQATGEERFADAARFWFRRTLDGRRDDSGFAGLLTFMPTFPGEESWEADGGFLTGAAGTALALLAAVEPIEPRWDCAILTSLPAPSLLGAYE